MTINLLNDSITKDDVKLIQYVLLETSTLMKSASYVDSEAEQELSSASRRISVTLRELDKPHPSLSYGDLDMILFLIADHRESESDPILRSRLSVVGGKIAEVLEALDKHR